MADQIAKLTSGAGTGLGPAERRLLAGMPLHAITSVHGEAGLRERLLLEITRFPLPIAARSRTRWRWHPGCTRETGGSANPTQTTC
jgi:hypothetical protein